MSSFIEPHTANRYEIVPEKKSSGATYTPKPLADFVARQMIEAAGLLLNKPVIRVLDPAVGDGELLVSLLRQFSDTNTTLEVFGFDTDAAALKQAHRRLHTLFPAVTIQFQQKNFLDHVLSEFNSMDSLPLFADQPAQPEQFDLIIANPPYVRTQIIGATEARTLAQQFGLDGRVDLYYAFLIAMTTTLRSDGVAGIIVSNRFMTTKSGTLVRAALRKGFNLCHIWDLGDTKLFDAAVLPSVLLAQGRNASKVVSPRFTSIYKTTEPAQEVADNALAALSKQGVITLLDGKNYIVKQGKLDTSGDINAVWRITTEASDNWIKTVEAHSWGTFRDIGKIRVGVKTCADKVFIRSDWRSLGVNDQPELLRALTTHHVARRFKALSSQRRQILYPHQILDGQRQAVDIKQYPRAEAYLEQHRAVLEARKYVLEAGRQWFEIWVPQDPAAWDVPKLVFRDISEKPTFWIDQDGTVINGDCYWIIAEQPENEKLLWLAAAVANSTFIEVFYDHKFNNKLYAGRRRFITQYVEQFPLPDPQSTLSIEIMETAKAIYEAAGTQEAAKLENSLNRLIWRVFGFSGEEILR